MTQRAYNFSAGPAVLPEPVLKQVQRDMMALPGPRASILEISHRSETFQEILAATEANLRTLLSVPDDYSVLFIQGGGRVQFSMIPLNFRQEERLSADYLVTGSWGKEAFEEAHKQGEARAAWDGADSQYSTLPSDDELKIDPQTDYVYYTSNETIEGVQFKSEPAVGNVPLICDVSSDFLHKPIDIARYGLIYACAQKNIGPAGVAVVIVRNDLLQRSSDQLPSYLNYRVHAERGSMLNTPPTFAIYVVQLVTDWLLNEIGGLAPMYAINQSKAQMLYEAIDASDGFYQGHAAADCRSLMNVAFRLSDDEQTAKFLAKADEQNLTALAGHRNLGGIRASIYNAMPVAGVEALCDFMKDFRKKN